MRKIILTYGIIAGLIVSVLMLASVNYFSHCEGNMDYGTSMLIGYASMLIAFSMVFVGIRNFRDKYNEGVITFGKVFKIGLLMVLIASTLYVIAWMITNHYFLPDFIEKYSAHMLEELKASGASPQEIADKTTEMANFARMYQNPFFKALMTYAEILPIGIVVALVSALILKKNPDTLPHG